ncbi:MAG TPA: glycosyltransferase family 4 protein [Bdellovibrionota bacterium]
MGNRRDKENHRVGIVHVPYLVRGGEDAHVATLPSAYSALGYETFDFVAALKRGTSLADAGAALTAGHRTAWDQVLEAQPVRFLHVHNIHPLLGPAFLRWVAARRIPALMTVHNHRFYCTNGLALYQGKECKVCRDDPSFLRPILRNCNSDPVKSTYHSTALFELRRGDLLARSTRRLLAPSPYIAKELEAAGIDTSLIRTLPHGIELPEIAHSPEKTDIIFVGRFSEEKGIRQFLAAAALLPELRMTIVGEGPLRKEVEAAATKLSNVCLHGKLARNEMLSLMQSAKVACVPSICQESFSLVAAEALSFGLHLVVADSASLRHYGEAPGRALKADPRSAPALAEALRRAVSLPPRNAQETSHLRDHFSRAAYEQRLRSILTELGW